MYVVVDVVNVIEFVDVCDVIDVVVDVVNVVDVVEVFIVVDDFGFFSDIDVDFCCLQRNGPPSEAIPQPSRDVQGAQEAAAPGPEDAAGDEANKVAQPGPGTAHGTRSRR